MNSGICLLSHSQVANSHKFLEKVKVLQVLIVAKRGTEFWISSSFALYSFQFLSMDSSSQSYNFLFEFPEMLTLKTNRL